MTVINVCAFLFFFPRFLFMPNDASYESTKLVPEKMKALKFILMFIQVLIFK